MVKLIEEKTVQLGKVTPSLNSSLVDYAKLIGITKIELLEELIAKELKGRVLTKGLIVPDKPFYFNMEDLLTEGTVVASINKPSREFNKYFMVKRIANNLDSITAEFRTYCYNDNKYLHKGIFVYYLFSTIAKPVPLVFDYNIESNELVISVVKLSELTLLIESEEDVVTVEEIIKTVKDNVETYNSLAKEDITSIETEEFYLKMMSSISKVMEDFKGIKQIDLWANYNVNEFNKPLAEDVVDYSFIKKSIKTEDIFQKLIQQEKELKKLNENLKDFKEFKESVEDIKKWWLAVEQEHKED